jgi:predicted GNAT superfamily acetyltransferase
MTEKNIEIREVSTVEELQGCVDLQRSVFATPDLENSPVRHLIVTKYAGGFTLAAFDGERMVGFVLSVPMFKGTERAFYSHMTAVDKNYQNYGIGAKLKWAQRERALQEGVNYIKWTFQPVQARNAFFNLERLGATINVYAPNFYGTGNRNRVFAQPKSTGTTSFITKKPRRKSPTPNSTRCSKN